MGRSIESNVVGQHGIISSSLCIATSRARDVHDGFKRAAVLQRNADLD
jgi:hypothetical protein